MSATTAAIIEGRVDDAVVDGHHGRRLPSLRAAFVQPLYFSKGMGHVGGNQLLRNSPAEHPNHATNLLLMCLRDQPAWIMACWTACSLSGPNALAGSRPYSRLTTAAADKIAVTCW